MKNKTLREIRGQNNWWNTIFKVQTKVIVKDFVFFSYTPNCCIRSWVGTLLLRYFAYCSPISNSKWSVFGDAWCKTSLKLSSNTKKSEKMFKPKYCNSSHFQISVDSWNSTCHLNIIDLIWSRFGCLAMFRLQSVPKQRWIQAAHRLVSSDYPSKHLPHKSLRDGKFADL